MRLPAVYAPIYPAPTARISPQALADLSATSAPVPHAIEQVATDPAKQAPAALRPTGEIDSLAGGTGFEPPASRSIPPSPRSRRRNRKFADSPLEGDGFEPLVPQREGTGFSRPPRATSGPFTSTGSNLPRQRDRIAALAIWECRGDAERTVDCRQVLG
jgi:hypothetical protein